MRELNARIRVGGLSDDEAAALPVQLDGLTISRSQISTWSTDAGYLDVLVDMVNRQGHRQRYEDLEGAAEELTVAGVQVRVAGLGDIIPRRSTPGAPRTMKRSPSSTGSVTPRRGTRLRAGSRTRSASARAMPCTPGDRWHARRGVRRRPAATVDGGSVPTICASGHRRSQVDFIIDPAACWAATPLRSGRAARLRPIWSVGSQPKLADILRRWSN